MAADLIRKSCSDFHGIVISSIISKVFEQWILDRFNHYFGSNVKLVGFKSWFQPSRDAVRNIVNRFADGGSIVNMCA